MRLQYPSLVPVFLAIGLLVWGGCDDLGGAADRDDPSDAPPEASIEASTSSGPAPLHVTFDGTASVDPERSPLTYRWTTSDGAVGEGPSFERTFEQPDTVVVSLTVTDGAGLTDADTVIVEVHASDTPSFTRVVALGDGWIAGTGGAGIDRSTQEASFAVLVAEALGATFDAPLIEPPGCPAPIIDAYTRERAGASAADACTGLVSPAPSVIHNVAIPGARLADVFRPDSAAASPLNRLLLGGRTQVEAAVDAEPTFAIVLFGMEEIVARMRTGGTVTFPVASFNRDYKRLLDRLVATGVRHGVVIGMHNLLGLPYWGSGTAFAEAEAAGELPPTFTTTPSCRESGPSSGSAIPFDYSADLYLRALQGEEVVLDCRAEPVIRGDEMGVFGGDGYLAFEQPLRAWAQENDWAYTSLGYLLGYACDAPRLPGPPNTAEPTFGPCFAEDGLHLSPEGHRRAAGVILDAISRRYGTNIPGI